MVRYAGYIRVSSEKQVDGYSLDAQRKAIEGYVAARGDGELIRVYIDGGESAKTVMNRDQFLEMRRDASNQKFDALVVHKFDRLNRNRMDAMSVKTLLRHDYGIKVFSATEPSEDQDGPMGALVEGILESVADWFSRNLAAEVHKGRLEKAEQGIYQSTYRPYGYLPDKDLGLIPHPDEAPVVRWLFDEYATGAYSYYALSKILNDQGILTPTNRPWDKAALARLLTNPVYAGKIRYQAKLTKPDGSRDYYGPTVILDAKHEALVNEELFNAVQEIAKLRNTQFADLIRKTRNLPRANLLGTVYCADCLLALGNEPPPNEYYGRMYIKRMVRKNAKGHDVEYLYYTCWQNHPYARLSTVEGEVLDVLLSDQLPQDWKQSVIVSLANQLGNDDLDRRVQEIKDTIARMDFRWDQGFITNADEFLAKRQALMSELAVIEPQRDAATDKAWKLVNNFRTAWDDAPTIEERRKLIGMIVDRIVVSDRHVETLYLKPDGRVIFVTNRNP